MASPIGSPRTRQRPKVSNVFGEADLATSEQQNFGEATSESQNFDTEDSCGLSPLSSDIYIVGAVSGDFAETAGEGNFETEAFGLESDMEIVNKQPAMSTSSTQAMKVATRSRPRAVIAAPQMLQATDSASDFTSSSSVETSNVQPIGALKRM